MPLTLAMNLSFFQIPQIPIQQNLLYHPLLLLLVPKAQIVKKRKKEARW